MKRKNEKLRRDGNPRRSWFIFVLLLLTASTNSMATILDNKPITIQRTGISITDALDMVKQQAGVSIVYQDDVINKSMRLNLNLKEVTLREALNAICEPAGLEYILRDNYVLIKKGKRSMITKKNPVAAPLSSSGHRTITGKVVDEKGEPLIGVNVTVAGTSLGAISDNDGNYSIKIPEEGNVKLMFSYVGMVSRTVTAGKKAQMPTITMQEDNAMMNEVVVTGYQQIDRRNLTSSVTSVKMKDLMLPGVSSLDQMLAGRIPDMMVTSSSSEINAVPKIRIRGTSTIIGNREPLWVVDGVIVNDPVSLSADVINDPDYVNRIGNAISGLNPQDIERIDVLKDAAATALYGTRAANGIIVITTKKGRVGKPIVSYSFNGTYRRRPRYTDHKINLMNSLERTQVSRELVDMHYQFPSGMTSVGYEDAVSKYYSGVYSLQQFNDAVAKAETQNTDWFKLLCRDSFSNDHSVNISGGSDRFRYYASLGYTDENDVIKENMNKRYTASTHLDFTLSDRFQASLAINAYHNKRQYDESDVSPIDYAYKTSRVIPAYNDDGTYYYYLRGGSAAGSMNFNIMNEIDNSYMKQTINGITATLNLRYHFTDWLNLNGVFSYGSTDANIEGWYGEDSWYAAQLRGITSEPQNSLMPFGGELSTDNTSSQDYTARIQANINKDFGSNHQHNINLSIGGEANSTLYKGFSYTGRGYYKDRGEKFVTNIPDKYTSYRNWLATNVPTITDSRTNLLSAYGTLSYSFMEYFTLNANTRYDGSNKFGTRSNEKILPVWSVSGLANMKEIAKIQAPWIDALVLKASYGEQGNMLDGQTPVMLLKKGAMDTHYNEMVSTVSAFANPDLKWEKTHSFNTGIEASFFKSRLMLQFEYYYKKTTDAFMNKTISDINGYTSYVVNSGNIVNRGYNISITATPVQTRDFNWLFSGSLSKVMNKMKTAPGQDYYELDDYLNGTAVVKGKSLSTFYSYRFVGLNPEDGGPLFDDWEDRSTELIGLSKNETYTKVLTASGKRDADITGSISNTLEYKGWRLGVLMNYNLGNKVRLFKVFDQGEGTTTSGPGYIYPEYNLNRALLNRWKKSGDEKYTNIPSIIGQNSSAYYKYSRHWSSGSNYTGVKIADDSWTMYDYSDIRVVSGNYLRLANVSLTYEVPTSFLGRYKLQRLALTLSGSNLYTWCAKALKGQAPTQSGFSTVQLSDTPYYTFGVNIQF
jgi:TonB-linked SusC/RagA family outer membrane protein